MIFEYRLKSIPAGFNCPICMDLDVKKGRVHPGGDDHPICNKCAIIWAKKQDDPRCAVCRSQINPRSLMNKNEIRRASQARNAERINEERRQNAGDLAVAQRLAVADLGLALPPGSDAAIAAVLQAQERAGGLRCDLCMTVAIAVAVFAVGVWMIG